MNASPIIGSPEPSPHVKSVRAVTPGSAGSSSGRTASARAATGRSSHSVSR